MKQRVFLGRLLVALKRAGCGVCWLWKVPVLVYQIFKVMPFCLPLHVTAFSIDQLLRRFVICLSMCQWCAASSRWCRGQAHVLYDVHTFLHQSPNSVVDWVSESTGLFGGHRSGEIKSGVCCWRSWTVLRAQSDVRTRHFYRSCLKANKVNKNEETRKIEHAHHFWKYAATDYQKISKLSMPVETTTC